MALNLKIFKFSRPLFLTSRSYCNKSIYQKNEDIANAPLANDKPYSEWRKPWIKRDGEWHSKLSLFVERNPSPDYLRIFSSLPNMSVEKVKEWWASMKTLQEIENQSYLPERVAALGSNLAALHFFTYRLCEVRLKDSREWIKGDLTNLNLPDHFVDGYLIEAIDCTNFHHNGIRYEGLENLRGLTTLRWLSLKNNKHVDVWCLDRISSLCCRSLEHLDISGCQFETGSIFAIAKMRALKMLIVTDPGDNTELQCALSILEQENPKLLIRTVAPAPHNIKI